MKITSIRCPDLPLSRRIAMILKQYHGQMRKHIQHPIAGKYYPLLLRLDTKAGQVTQQDLVEYLGIDKTSMVRIIDELVQVNLISRAPNPADRRFHQIHLTDQGKALMPEIRGAINNVNNLMMNGLSDAESNQFILSLQHIQDNLNQLDQSATNDCVPAQSKDI